MQTTKAKLAKTVFIVLALIVASLLPAAQFVGISYATNNRGNDHDDNDDDHDDNDDDDSHDDDNNDNSDGLTIKASKDTFLRKSAPDTNEGANDIGFVEDPDIPNGDRIAITGEPSSGTVTINEDGTVTYEPENGFKGIVTFVYTIYTPNFTDFDSATVTVTVENPP